MKRKGYHYTTHTLWEKIKKDGGLKPQKIKEEIVEFFPNGVKGLWLWGGDFEGVAHAGFIIFQVAKKASPHIVKLEVLYNEKDLLKYFGREIELHHHGKIGNWEYQRVGKGPQAIIVRKPIPLNHIKLIGSYNAVEMLQ